MPRRSPKKPSDRSRSVTPRLMLPACASLGPGSYASRVITSSLFISGIVCSEVERDVGQHVLLAAHQLALAGLDEDVASVDAVLRRCNLGVPQEAAVDARVA